MSRKKRKGSNEPPPRSPTGSTRRMAPRSRKTGFVKLRAMVCFPEVHDKLCKGWPLNQLATWIQEEQQEYTDVEHVSLVKVLQNYRDSIPAGERSKYALSKSHLAAIAQVEDDIDEMREMIKLYRRQERRMEIDGKVEEQIGKLLPTMTQDVRVTLEILNRIAQLKMDLGVNERHLGTVDLEAQMLAGVEERYAGTDVGTVLTDPKKRRRLLNIAEHALSLSKRGVGIEGELVIEDEETGD